MAALLFVAVSCGLKEIGSQPVVGDGIWIGPGSALVGNGSEAEDKPTVWYAVGVDYPQEYDWRADVEKGSVKCSLVVFADGVPMMKLPVGDAYEVSSDPDMHRMVRGDLYTDYSTQYETVIKRNGEEIIRYMGREMIVDMAVEGDFVYTLGFSRSGTGFAFRRNGEVLLERASGYAFPRVQRVEDGFSFAFYEESSSGNRIHHKYYHYLAGEVCPLSVPDDVIKVWDVLLYEDRVCYLASEHGVRSPVLVTGEDRHSLKVEKGAEAVNCRFIDDGGELYIEGIMSREEGGLSSAIWKGPDLVEVFPEGYTVASACGYDDEIACVLNGSGIFPQGIIYYGGENVTMPSGYVSMGGQTVVMSNGMLCVGLTSKKGSDAAVWVKDELKPLKINGFISHMSVY